MGGLLGPFGSSNVGKIVQLRTDFDAHAALTGSAAHGAVSAATVNQIMTRDASGRVDVVAPPAADNTTKVVTSAWVTTELTGLGTVTSVGSGTGLTGGPITGAGTLNLANTAVTPATYTFATLTVDAQGRLTAASSGTPVTAVTGTLPMVSSGGTTPALSIPAATASVAGHATATQITKLDGIETGAEVNDVTTVFGRTGAIVAVANDYNISEIEGFTISDSVPTGGVDGDIWLEY